MPNQSPLPTPQRAEDEGYLASLSDLMVGLLFIFIIILMAFALNYRQAETVTNQETMRLVEETEARIAEQLRLEQETEAQQQEKTRLLKQTIALQAETTEQRLEKLRLMEETAAQIQEKRRLRQEKQELEKIIERLTNNDTVRQQMLREIQYDLAKRGIRVFIDEKNGILRLPEELLFDSGAASFRPAGQQAISQLAQVLIQILPCYSVASAILQQNCRTTTGLPDTQARLEAVFIEGHTDDRPIKTNEFADNWVLASTRALNTYKALVTAKPALESLQNPQQQALLSVSAYEARRPVATQATAEERRKNRRIDMRFIMASPPPTLVEQAQQRLEGISE